MDTAAGTSPRAEAARISTYCPTRALSNRSQEPGTLLNPYSGKAGRILFLVPGIVGTNKIGSS